MVFFLTHSVPVRPPVKPWLVERLGQGGFTLAYSALSLAVLAWLIGATGRAPYVELWPWAPWQAWVPLVGMAVACAVVALAVGRPNPFSFGGINDEAFDPSRPGIVRWSRHPLLIALAIWAASHVVPNGDLAHLVLFGLFAGFALVGGRLVDRRARRRIGAAEWQALANAVARSPVLPRPISWPAAALRLALAVALYAALLALHPWLFGVSPLT